jgi:flavin-dependent dehydrogenase
MLAQAARQAGANLYCGAKVTSYLPLAGDPWPVAFTSGVASSRQEHQLRATYLIDATGRAAVLARRQGANRLNADRLVGLAGVLAARSRESDGPEDECDSCTLVEACADGWWYSALLPGRRLMAVYMTQSRLRAFDLQAALRVVAANSSRLDRASGRGWLAVGDAVMAFDPLSSQGLVQALASGIRAGEALNGHLAGEDTALADYDIRANDAFREYSRLRAVYYGREQRWPQSDFWQRRHAVAA